MAYEPSGIKKCPRCGGGGLIVKGERGMPYYTKSIKKCGQCNGNGFVVKDK